MRRALEPLALMATLEAERMHKEQAAEGRRIAGLELEQARYEAALAERRYAACDPDNRLIAAQLEKSWEETLRRVRACQEKLGAGVGPAIAPPESLAPSNDREKLGLDRLSDDLETAWHAPGTSPFPPRRTPELIRGKAGGRSRTDEHERTAPVMLTRDCNPVAVTDPA